MGVGRIHPCARAIVAALSLGVAMGCASPPLENREVRCPVAARLLAEARALIQCEQFQEAYEKLVIARQFDPEDKEILSAYRDVSRVRERLPAAWNGGGWDPEAIETNKQDTRLQVLIHLEKGLQFMEERRYAAAEAEFRTAVETIKWVPVDVGMNDELEEAKALAAKACRLRKAEEERGQGEDPK